MNSHIMLILLCVGVTALSGAMLNTKATRVALIVAFALIFAFMAARYDFGNDYMSYYDIFYESSYIDAGIFSHQEGHSEAGWIALCQLFQPIGFFGFVAFLALLNCVVYYRLIASYCPARYYWLALFIYLADANNMLVQLSAMRQSLSISIFVIAVTYFVRGRVAVFSALVFLASLIHTSALVGFLLLPLYFFRDRLDRVTFFAYVVAYFLLFLIVDQLAPLINSFMPAVFNRYEIYQDAASLKSGFGAAAWSLIFVFLMYYASKLSNEYSLLVKIGAVSFLILPLGFALSMAARLGYYFQAVLVVGIPLVVANVENKVIRRAFIVFLTGVIAIGYIQFFKSPIWMNKFSVYGTIFNAP